MRCPDQPESPARYVGRFAPSPTGDLHFGSLLAAVGSRLQCHSQSGLWLVRIEDIDPPREVAGAAESILASLSSHGMSPAQPVLRQSGRRAAYRRALEQLIASGQAYWCGCSRADIPKNEPYPGTCRYGLPAGKKPRCVRLKTSPNQVRFVDAVHGLQQQDLRSSCGDFIIWRADNLPAYQLAVVVDDAFQGITEVVRGMDLLESTARQVCLQQALGLNTPAYAHLPLVTDAQGNKLSKRLKSDPIDEAKPIQNLNAAMTALGQVPPEATELNQWWHQATHLWRLERVPASPVRLNGPEL